MKIKWTPELHINLIKAVERAINCGYHRNNGPKRSDNFSPGFWEAVSIILSDGPDSPGPGACRSRYKDALAYYESTASLTEELKKLDTTWDEVNAYVDQFEADSQDYMENMIAEVFQKLGRIDERTAALAQEWGLKEL